MKRRPVRPAVPKTKIPVLSNTDEAAVALSQWSQVVGSLQKPQEALKFIKVLARTYEYDDDMLCEALVYSMLAGATAFAREYGLKTLTLEQTQWVLWSFLGKWLQTDEPIRLLRISYMLEPEMREVFNTALPRSFFDWLQEAAKERLEALPDASKERREHWQSIVDGAVPFGYTLEERDE